MKDKITFGALMGASDKFTVSGGCISAPTITYDIRQMCEDVITLKDIVINLQKDIEDIKKLLKEHFDCAPDGPLYIEAKDRFENNRYL